MKIQENIDNKRVTLNYKSLFTEGKLYADSLEFPSELFFLQRLMWKGPQIYSQIDKWILEVSGVPKNGACTQF